MEGDEETPCDAQKRLLSLYTGSVSSRPWREDPFQPVSATQVPYLWKASVPSRWTQITNRPLQKIVGVYRQKRDTMEFIMEKQKMLEKVAARNREIEEARTNREVSDCKNKADSTKKRKISTRRAIAPHKRSSSASALDSCKSLCVQSRSPPRIHPQLRSRPKLFATAESSTRNATNSRPPSRIDKFFTHLQAEQMQKKPSRSPELPFQVYSGTKGPVKRLTLLGARKEVTTVPTFHLRPLRCASTERRLARSATPREVCTQTAAEDKEFDL